jgi:hypothetical protein
MYQTFFIPSIYAHIFNGMLLLVAVILLYKNYSKLTRLEPYKIVILALGFSIAIGVHGISHLGLEQNYNYNPVNSMNL